MYQLANFYNVAGRDYTDFRSNGFYSYRINGDGIMNHTVTCRSKVPELQKKKEKKRNLNKYITNALYLSEIKLLPDVDLQLSFP